MTWKVWLLATLVACGDNRGVEEREPLPGLVPELAVVPTYHRNVAAILGERCTGCHVDGGVAPFALTSYEEARALSAVIAGVTAERVMPPWPADASGACGTFVEPRWLSDRELAILAAWDAAGAPLGDPAEHTLARPPAVLPFAPAVELVPAAYLVRPGPDEYRCFVVDPALTEDRYITALAMRIDRAEVVHHMQLFAADSAAGEATIDQREALDPEPGYACDDDGVGAGLRYIGVWAGGDTVRRWPDDTGIQIRAHHRLVVQLHYHNHGAQPVLDQTGVALELAPTVAQAGRITSAQATSFTLAPGQADVTISTTVGLPLDGPAQIRGARIHMHELGTSARLEVVRAGHDACVLDIPRWDVGWQLFYRFAEPIAVDAGDQIRIRCSYDTRSRVDPVRWGSGTDDEMCIGYTFLTP